MPKKPKKSKTTSGKPLPVGPTRVAFTQKARLENDYSTARDLVMAKFKVSKATAERDIAQADALIADDAAVERPMLRIIETRRLQRVAAKAETDKQYSAVASLSREVAKINGLHAPKKIEVSQKVTVSMRITSLVGVLDARGIAALEIVQEQIEAARQRGVLPVATEGDRDDGDADNDGGDPA